MTTAISIGWPYLIGKCCSIFLRYSHRSLTGQFGIMESTQVVFEATDKILQNCVIPQCSEKVNSGNRTEWSLIQSAIIQVQVINKIRRAQSRSPI